MDNLPPRYVYLSNIPLDYHASDLRNFFSQFIESRKFICFHFRHRPRIILSDGDSVKCSELLLSLRNKQKDKSSRCCIISMCAKEISDFLANYGNTHWLSTEDDMPLYERCTLQELMMESDEEDKALKTLIEFKPLSWMPMGNVGTPASHFFRLIKDCRLECSLIKKLGLKFSNIRQRKYGSVPYSYGNVQNVIHDKNLGSEINDVRSYSGKLLVCDDEFLDFTSIQEHSPTVCDLQSHSVDQVELESDADEPAEDWERFEALHDDPYHINRGDKANRKYEDKIELVWEKGGSGLVFHTDERTWRKLDPLRKEELFDEPSSFDWDIDMEPYEKGTGLGVGPSASGHWGSARDTADLVDISRSREDIDAPSLGHNQTALYEHEVYTKGFGSRQMKRMGWKPGSALGINRKFSNGSAYTIIDTEKSLPPHVRTGLGYYGPRVLRQSHSHAFQTTDVVKASRTDSVYIRTVFDSSKVVAERSGIGFVASLLRRPSPEQIIKYRSNDISSLPANESVENINCVPYRRTSNVRTLILTPHTTLSKEGISFVSGGFLYPGKFQGIQLTTD